MSKPRKGEWVEIVVAWGEQVLAVRHLSVAELATGRSFWLGDGAEPCDFVLGPEELGSARFALVDSLAGVPHVHLPPSSEEARAASDASAHWSHAAPIPLGKEKAVVHLGALTFHVRLAPPEEAPRGDLIDRIDRSALASFGATLGTAAALFGALAYTAAPLWADDDAMVSPEHVVLMRQLLEASAEREEKQKELEAGGSSSDSNSSASEPKSEPTPTPVKSLVSGPRRSDTPGPSRAEMITEARTGGMVALLNSLPSAMPVPWGNVPSNGQLAMADAGMFGGGLGEESGFGNLDFGNGSGGPGAGVHIDGVSGLPGGTGGPGGPGGEGSGTRGPGLGDHKTRPPGAMRMGVVNTSGRLPPEVIRRVVRQNFGRLRMCYEQGLGRNPNLEGRVEVRFLIGSDGRVTSASAGASSVPDSTVTSCVVSTFYSIGFPSPESGSVRVTYPITFVPQ